METQNQVILAHLQGEQPVVEARSAIADTFAGRIHVEWDATAPVTPFGQLPFFIDYLKQAGLFDARVADCPLSITSPNAPTKRDLLGTVLLSVLAGHRRYAHITALGCDVVNPPLLGMRKVLSEDAVRRGLAKIEGNCPGSSAKSGLWPRQRPESQFFQRKFAYRPPLRGGAVTENFNPPAGGCAGRVADYQIRRCSFRRNRLGRYRRCYGDFRLHPSQTAR